MRFLIIAITFCTYAFNSANVMVREKHKQELKLSHQKECIEQEKLAYEEKQKQVVYYANSNTYEVNYEPGVLNKRNGVNYNENGNKETYYNLPMSRVVQNAKDYGLDGEYWVRDDGVKMFGDYVIIAANQENYGYGTTVETSLGTAIVLDTGSFAESNPEQFDIAVDW